MNRQELACKKGKGGQYVRDIPPSKDSLQSMPMDTSTMGNGKPGLEPSNHVRTMNLSNFEFKRENSRGEVGVHYHSFPKGTQA